MRKRDELTRSMSNGQVAAAVLVFQLLVLAPASYATTWTVCSSGCDFASLQAAVDAAANGDRIELLDPVHTEARIVVGKDLEIAGVGSPRRILQAANVPGALLGSVLIVEPVADLLVEDLTIRHGSVRGAGGGILNQGELILERVEVVQNEGGLGAGVRTTGRLELRDSAVSFNTGVGISATGELLVVDSELRGNQASEQDGGGIWTSGSALIEDSVIADNVARRGGGIHAQDLVIHDSLVENNQAERGGGALVTSLVSMRVVWAANTATHGSGGGLWMNKGGIFGGALMDNSAAVGGGGVYAAQIEPGRSVLVDGVTFGNNNANAGGGLFFNVGGAVRNSLFVGNQATTTGGGFHLQCCLAEGFSAAVSNSTFSGNTAFQGGGVYLFGAADFSNVTWTENVADPGGLGASSGGGIFVLDVEGGVAILRNSILAGNFDLGPDPLRRAADCSGAVLSDGFNSVGTLGLQINLEPACEVSGLAVNVGGNQGLAALGDNGGATHTHALLPDSPNVDTGDPNGCLDDLDDPLSRDQRDAERVGACDRGAYERAGDPAWFADGFESGGLGWWSSHNQ